MTLAMEPLSMTDPSSGLIHALLLDGRGGARRLGLDEIRQWRKEDGALWLHLKFMESSHALLSALELDELSKGLMMSEDHQPRYHREGDVVFGTWRGINSNQGQEESDMPFVNFWSDGQRLITLRAQKLGSIHLEREALEHGKGAKDIGDLFSRIPGRINEYLGNTLERLEETMDELEETLLKSTGHVESHRFAELRMELIVFHRYFLPQRSMLLSLKDEELSWLKRHHRRAIKEHHDRLHDRLNSMDALKDRILVLRDEYRNRSAEKMNRAIYLLSVITGLFLPLGFLTGLMGTNVGGIPGANDPMGFWVVLAAAVVIDALALWLFKRLKLI